MVLQWNELRVRIVADDSCDRNIAHDGMLATHGEARWGLFWSPDLFLHKRQKTTGYQRSRMLYPQIKRITCTYRLDMNDFTQFYTTDLL